MSRRYYRRRRKDDLATPIGVILCIILLGEYFQLSRAQKNTLKLVLIFLVIAVLVITVLFKLKQREHNNKMLRALELVDANMMSGTDFEKYVAEIIKSQGYANVKLTEYYDWGVDIIAEKDGVRWGIQVKRYSGMVKAAAVRQVVTGLNKYNCSRAMVVTNSFYSRPARELAKSNNCVLVDKNTLAEWIIAFQSK